MYGFLGLSGLQPLSETTLWKSGFFFRRSAPAQTKVKHKKAPNLSVKKQPGNHQIAGTDFKKPAVPPRLTSFDVHSCIPTYAALCSRRVRAPSSILRNYTFFSGRPQKPIRYLLFPPLSHHRRFSVKKRGKFYLHFINGFSIVKLFINPLFDFVNKIQIFWLFLLFPFPYYN